MRVYLAPVISKTPDQVSITHCYWGDLGAYFRFQGVSMPASPITDMGRAVKGKVKSDLDHVRSDIKQVHSEIKQVGSDIKHVGSEIKHVGSEIKQAGAELKQASGLKHLGADLKQAGVDLKNSGAHLSQVKSALKASKERMEAYRPGQLLFRLDSDGLSDLALRVISAVSPLSGYEQTLALLAADEAASELAADPELAKCRSIKDELSLFQNLMRSKYTHLRSLHNLPELKKKPEWLKSFGTNLLEGLDRYAELPGFIMTRAAAEVRSPLNSLVTTFIGDVFTYIRERGTWENPGPIPQRALDALLKASEMQKSQMAQAGPNAEKEPLVVLSHSMGGQIAYDLVTHFLPNDPKYKDVYIDFWCASASQVGFFEELKLFLASDEKYSARSGKRVPRPDKSHLGYWWNVWDHNDFISYSAKNIFEGVEDSVYNTGMFLSDAHGGYLVRPSFFRQFAGKLKYELEQQRSVPTG
jgi:hypothetical protein